MPANKYFNHFKNKKEQGLLDDLMAEAIEIYGINAIYIPRSGEVNLFYGEDPRAKFDRWYEMVLYVKDTAGFSGKATLQKWGITMEQSITFQMSKREFAEAVGVELNPNRPKEGDLLYLPYGLPGQYLLEVKYVNDNIPFVELGEDYLYEIDCRMFTYGNETIKTGLDDVDAISREIKQEIEIQIGAGSGTYVLGEIVYQGTSFATSSFKALVKGVQGNTLHVSNMTGSFNEALLLNGNTSFAMHAVGGDEQDIKNDKQAQNKIIQTGADPVFIKNPRNPFDKGKL